MDGACIALRRIHPPFRWGFHNGELRWSDGAGRRVFQWNWPRGRRRWRHQRGWHRRLRGHGALWRRAGSAPTGQRLCRVRRCGRARDAGSEHARRDQWVSYLGRRRVGDPWLGLRKLLRHWRFRRRGRRHQRRRHRRPCCRPEFPRQLCGLLRRLRGAQWHLGDLWARHDAARGGV